MENASSKREKTIAELRQEIAALEKEKKQLEEYILLRNLANHGRDETFDLSTLGLKQLKRS